MGVGRAQHRLGAGAVPAIRAATASGRGQFRIMFMVFLPGFQMVRSEPVGRAWPGDRRGRAPPRALRPRRAGPRSTRSARKAQSTRRATSWRAGIERKGAGVVVEADGVVEAGGFGRQLAEAPHALRGCRRTTRAARAFRHG